MQFQAFNKILIGDQRLERFDVDGVYLGWKFRIRYPSYRGTYLSCIEKMDIYLDDEKIDPARITFALNGIEYTMDELKDQYKAYWFVLDYAEIRVLQDAEPQEGPHKVTVDMYHRIPYAGYDGGYLGLPSTVSKELIYSAVSC